MKSYGNYFSDIGKKIFQSNACSYAKGSDTLPRPREGNSNDFFTKSFSEYRPEMILQHCKNISGNTEVILKKSKAISMAQNEILKLKKLMLLNGQQQRKDPSLKSAVQNRIKSQLQEKTAELQRNIELRKKSVDEFNQSIGVAHQHANQLLSRKQEDVSRLIAKIDGQIDDANKKVFLSRNAERHSGIMQNPAPGLSGEKMFERQNWKPVINLNELEKKRIYQDAVSSEFNSDKFQSIENDANYADIWKEYEELGMEPDSLLPHAASSQPQRILDIEKEYTKCETKVKGLKNLIEELKGKIESNIDEERKATLNKILDDATKTHEEAECRLVDVEMDLFLAQYNEFKFV